MAPVVSVCIITYNHELYIRQALDSVLVQKVNFPWEIIIADDCSTDKTREILYEYKEKHPDLIRLILQEKNTRARKNYIDLVNSATGKYIAYLEGDDYWTDPLKLQKQFDFMELNPGFSMCYHKIKWVWTYASDWHPDKESNVDDPPESTVYDVLNRGWFIRSCSMFYKNFRLPKGFDKLHVGDYPLHVLLADKGNIGFLDETMGVYRVNDKGMSETNLLTEDITKRKKNLRAEIDMLKYMDHHTTYKYHRIFNRKQFDLLYSHVAFLKQNARSEVFKDMAYAVRAIGLIKLVRGFFNKIQHKKSINTLSNEQL
jgi:glycosyltransferase involved in cell wall biosynthesis